MGHIHRLDVILMLSRIQIATIYQSQDRLFDKQMQIEHHVILLDVLHPQFYYTVKLFYILES